ncbi:uncharacterized protein ARB_07665 [Trichophyton benhamiae CBS 112371]|uniref:Uncharacterized protein n=1 Tax=Arthroderma benhamiae (strain ATCC MYA-4681 / CBS 112371) TaxID=663331 RepID=D4ATU9_ARTBC|nr:uncharacterized protein ARB_07665 [Trichophyton benhamiae CBS 112371]EFE33718.1 hypothetical protein ARB_07665 [Trichophyton benhamiae CBS 112371]
MILYLFPPGVPRIFKDKKDDFFWQVFESGHDGLASFVILPAIDRPSWG